MCVWKCDLALLVGISFLGSAEVRAAQVSSRLVDGRTSAVDVRFPGESQQRHLSVGPDGIYDVDQGIYLVKDRISGLPLAPENLDKQSGLKALGDPPKDSLFVFFAGSEGTYLYRRGGTLFRMPAPETNYSHIRLGQYVQNVNPSYRFNGETVTDREAYQVFTQENIVGETLLVFAKSRNLGRKEPVLIAKPQEVDPMIAHEIRLFVPKESGGVLTFHLEGMGYTWSVSTETGKWSADEPTESSIPIDITTFKPNRSHLRETTASDGGYEVWLTNHKGEHRIFYAPSGIKYLNHVRNYPDSLDGARFSYWADSTHLYFITEDGTILRLSSPESMYRIQTVGDGRFLVIHLSRPTEALSQTPLIVLRSDGAYQTFPYTVPQQALEQARLSMRGPWKRATQRGFCQDDLVGQGFSVYNPILPASN